MKTKIIKAEVTIATGQFENIKPIIDIEVPEELIGEELWKHLHDRFHMIEKGEKKTS